jgi:hypothetical protein
MIIGRKNPKMPETAGGSTPEIMLNEVDDAFSHLAKKGT